jgi:hypothetical protein
LKSLAMLAPYLTNDCYARKARAMTEGTLRALIRWLKNKDLR